MVHGSSQDTMDVAIIGGGMAGISAAEYLVEKSGVMDTLRLTLFDKGMSLGGRCSARRMGTSKQHIVHHGCQLLCPQSQGFQDLWGQNPGEVSDGLVVIDPCGGIMHGREHTSNLQTFVGGQYSMKGRMYGGYQASGMLEEYFNRVSSCLSSVHKHCAVTELSWLAGAQRPWKVHAKDMMGGDELDVQEYHVVVVADWTAAMDLLIRPQNNTPRPLQEILGQTHIDRVEYLPTFALILEIHSKGNGLHNAVGFETAVVEGEGTGPLDSFKMIALQASEQSPDGTMIEYWVVLTSTKKSQELVSKYPMFDSQGKVVPQTRSYREAIAHDIEGDFRVALKTLLRDDAGTFSIVQSFGHRWGRAFTKPGTEIKSDAQSIYVSQYRLGICGDMFAPLQGESPVERAWQSGQAVSTSLVHQYEIQSKI